MERQKMNTDAKKKRQTVCKPGSVPLSSCEKSGDGHSSRRTLARSLKQPTRTASARKPACP